MGNYLHLFTVAYFVRKKICCVWCLGVAMHVRALYPWKYGKSKSFASPFLSALFHPFYAAHPKQTILPLLFDSHRRETWRVNVRYHQRYQYTSTHTHNMLNEYNGIAHTIIIRRTHRESHSIQCDEIYYKFGKICCFYFQLWVTSGTVHNFREQFKTCQTNFNR